MLKVTNLTVVYDDLPVFKQLAVAFAPGKITGIIGPNGAGKSTLIKGMLGLVKPQSGTACIAGQPLNKQLTRVAYVEQRKDLDLTFPINVFDVVLSGTYGKLGLFRSPGKREKKRAAAALEQVGLSDYAHRQIGNLSGGQLQRVFVARAIAQKADIIILDEPFVGIDLKSEHEIMQILKQWRSAGKIIIVIHHDLNKVTAYFDDLVIMDHGIEAAGPVAKVYTPENIRQVFSDDLSSVLFTRQAGEGA